ncbi:DUF1493 family protein [Citrobacter sp. UYEF32]|uniref:DUF1493 family protein n=1 Tax=Citrobacter sp. UYEF32 TaxID=3156347 RepID=UPI003393EF20
MVNNIEERVYELIRPYAGAYVLSGTPVPLTPDTDLDSDLSIDELEAEDLMEQYFNELHVERGNFNIKTYFPDTQVSWNPFKKREPVPVPDYTIGMLIESAKAGRWLYD